MWSFINCVSTIRSCFENLSFELFEGGCRLLLLLPITPKTFFRFVKSLHGIRKNAEKIFAIG